MAVATGDPTLGNENPTYKKGLAHMQAGQWAEAAACLQRLATLSLVNVGGTLWERRYSLHQLTQAFLVRQASDDRL